MPDPNRPSIWTKVNFDLVNQEATAPAAPVVAPDGSYERARHLWRPRRPLLDVVGAVFWLYAILKVFVTDLDSEVLGSLASYRFFFFLALAAILAIILQKRWAIVAGFMYVLAFPVVLLCWKLPKLLGKARSPVAFMAAANALTLVVGSIKRTIVAFALTAFSALAIFASHWRPLLILAGGLLLLLMLRTTYRTIRLSLQPSTFLRMQQKAIRSVVTSNVVKGMTTPTDDLQREDIERFNEQQQQAFIQNLANGVIAHRTLNYWAYQLERYRRSPASLIFNVLAFLWLVVRLVVGLALLNVALYHADVHAFEVHGSHSFFVFIRYVISGLQGGEIAAIHAKSEFANGLGILTFGAGVLLLGSLLVSSALAFRAARDESEIGETVAEIKREGDQLDAQLRENYDVSVNEAIVRLRQLRYGLLGVITFLSSRIPDGFVDEGPRSDQAQ